MFYLINKPLGYTSFDLIRKLRKLTWIKKMWHTGTLDPLASGCILVATEDSTKLISRLENQIKRYIFTVDISIFTPSFDLDIKNEPIQCDLSNLIDHSIEELQEFIESQTTQIPPKYSAIHIEWKRAYDLARKWKEFDMVARPIEVQNVKIIEKKLPCITIELTISSGGYIRSFAPLIGSFFGSTWWCITYLCRTEIWELRIEDCQNIDAFKTSVIVPYNKLLSHIKEYHLDAKYKKPLIDGLVLDIWSPEERSSGEEILVYCDDLQSLCKWTIWGIEVIKNYV